MPPHKGNVNHRVTGAIHRKCNCFSTTSPRSLSRFWMSAMWPKAAYMRQQSWAAELLWLPFAQFCILRAASSRDYHQRRTRRDDAKRHGAVLPLRGHCVGIE